MAAAKTLSSIALSGTYPTTFPQGGTFSHDGMTVTATYSNGDTADVTSSATFSGYNMATTGSQTVEVSYTEGGTTKTATYTITVQATPTHTLSSSVSPSGGGSVSLSASTVAEGATATATATPAAGYDFTSWSISGDGASLSSTSANPTTVTMGTANATVTANFTAKTPAGALTLSEAGTPTSVSVSNKYVGDTVTLPSDASTYPTDTDYDTFIGWYAGSYSNETTAPSDASFYAPGAPYTLTASAVTLKAVYAKSTTGESETRWKLATSVPSTSTTVILAGKDSSGNYYAMNSGSTSSVTYVTCAAITVADGMIAKNTTTTNYEFTFNPSDPSFTNAANGKLVLNASSLRINTGNANPPTSVTIDANGYTQIHRSTNTKYVVFAGSSSGFGQSGTAASSATTAVYMFTQQEVGGTTYGYYETDFATLYDIVADTVPGDKGTVSVTVGGAAADKAAEGATVNLSIADIPTGYHFVNWTGSYNGGTNNLTINNANNASTASFTMPAYAVSITANVALDTHTLTVNSDPASHGTVTKTVGGNTTALTTFDYGTNVTLTVSNIDSSWNFTGWSITKGGSTTADANTSVTVTMDADVTVTANYSQTPSYTITTQTSPANSGTITASVGGSAAATAEQGQTVNLSITGITAHYHFVNWTGSNSLSISNNTNPTGASFTMPGNDVTVTANLAIDTHTLTVVATNGSVDLDEQGDNVTEGTDTWTYTYGDTEVLTAEATFGDYKFVDWTVTGTSSYTASNNELAITIDGDITVTANYVKVQQLDVASVDHVTIRATPTGNNAINEGNYYHPQVGQTVTLNYSSLDSAYTWTGWDVYRTGASSTKVTVTGSGDGATFTMPDYPVTVSATVTEKPQYTVTYSVNGSTSEITAVTVHQGESVNLPTSSTSGMPASLEGDRTYDYFVGWATATIDGETSTAPDVLTGSYIPTGNITLYAVYSASEGGGTSQYELVSSAPTGGYAGTYLFVGLKDGTYYVMNGADTVANIDTAAQTPTLDSSLLSNSNTVIAASDATVNSYALTVEAATISSSSGYTIKGTDNNYIGNTYSTTSSTNRKFTKAASASTTNYLWTFDVTADSAQYVQNVGSSNYAVFNTSSTNVFRCYGSATNANYNLSLYKLTSGGTTYYATTAVVADRWTISYAAASGDTGVTGLPASHTVIQGETTQVSNTVPTREGYVFDKWYISSEDAYYEPGDDITPDDDWELVATWKPVWTITYAAGGDNVTGLPAAQTVTDGEDATVSSTVPTRPGYVFDGWEEIEEYGETFDAGDTITGVMTDLTLTATWTGLTWTIYDNGTQVASGNGPTTLPNAPSGTINNGANTYTFYKWGVVASEISTPTTTAPTAMYDAGASFAPTANGTVIRAVYTYDAEGGGGSVPSAAFAAGDTGTYVIAAYSNGNYIGLPNNPTISSGKIATSATLTVSESGGIIYVTNANASGYKWTLAKDGDYYTIEDAGNTGHYIYHSNGGASGTNLDYGETASYKWSITVSEGVATMAAYSGSSVSSRGILYRNDLDAPAFGGYAVGNASQAAYDYMVILPIGGAGSTTTNYLTLGSSALHDDLVLLTGLGAVTINVKANDLGVSDSDTVALDDDYTGFSVSADGKSIVFNPALIPGGFTAATTATYTIGSDSADVTVKPAERIFFEENSDLFNFVDGKRGTWEDVGSSEETMAQTLVGENGVFRTQDGSDYASLMYSGGKAKMVEVGSDVVNAGLTPTWPYVEFTFAGTGFEVLSVTSNTTGVIMYEVHQGDSTTGTLVGKRTIIDTYQGASYEGGVWSKTGNVGTFYQIPIVKVANLDYGTYTVRISASYASAYDHAEAGSYDLYFDGVRIFNPVQGDTAAYTYRSFREAVTTANSLGVIPDSTSVAATFYVDGVASPSLAQSAAAGSNITLPTLTDSDLSGFDAQTYHFYGWLAGSDLDNDTTTAPTDNFYAGGTSYTLNADTSFYAVAYYEETGAGNGGDYVKLVSGDEVTSGVYLIVCEEQNLAFNGSLTTLDAADNGASVTINTSGSINTIASDATVDGYTFTIDAAAGTIYSSSGFYIGRDTDANGMLSTANGAYANDITVDESDNAQIVGSKGAVLRFNHGSSDMRFRYYKSTSYTSQDPIQLYKKEGATATTYVTDLLEIVPQSLTLSGDVTNGGTLNLEVGDTASVTATLTTTMRKSTNLAFSTSPSGIVTLGGSGNTRSIHAASVGTTTVTVVCTGDNTIRASFTVNVSASSVKYGYTLNLMENGTAVTPMTATNQSTGVYTFTLPSAVDAANTPSGYTFVGWVAAEHTGNNSYSGTDAGLSSSTGYIAAGGEYEMTGIASDTAEATLYALYTKSEAVSASANATYQMVTSDSFSTSDTYVLAALKDSRYYFVNGAATSGSLGVESTGLASTALTGNTTFVATSLPSGSKELKVTAASGAKGIYYTVHDDENEVDVDYYLYATASAQSMSWSNENTSETFTPNFTQNSDTDGCVLTGSSGSKVSYNSSVTDKTKFIRNYASTGSFYTDLYFFKYVPGSGSGYVTNYYYTTGASSSSGNTGGAEGRGLTQAQVDALYTSTSQTLTVGDVSKTGFSNWGSRGEWATFLTTPAQSYYTDTYAITTLLQNSGGTGVSNFASSDLFTVLHSMLVAKHTTHGSYDAAKPILGLADCVENDTTQISSLYDGEMIATSAFGVSGTGWNREHCWPQSKLSATNAKNDAYLLRAEGQTTNSARGNTAYGKSSGYYYPNLGTYDVRGDVARIVMYVYTEYQESLLWGSSGVMESLDVMYEWMAADPVDTWEMGRNDVVEQFTGVRNPYVDYPELFFALFGYDIPANYRTPSAYYTVATDPDTAFSGSQAPASGDDESIIVGGNAIGDNMQVRGIVRSNGDSRAEAAETATRGTYNGTQILYVDFATLMHSGGTELETGYQWTDASAKFSGYLYDGSGNNTWVDFTQASGSVYKTTIPSGNWTNIVLLRWSPETSDTHQWSGYWARTGNNDNNMSMSGYDAATSNMITRFWEGGLTFTWSTSSSLAITGAAVMVNGMGAISDVEDYLTYGPKNELYLAEGNAIVVYVSGRATEVAVGAKALNGSPTQLSVYTINGDDSLTSVLTGATENKVSVVSASERFYPITVSDIYDSGTHAERSKILLIYNPDSNPVSLTNLRVNSSSNATLAVSTGSVTRGVHAVRSLRAGTAIITEPEGGNETPIIPISEQVPVLTNASLSLEGLIGVHFYLTVPASLISSGYFTVNDKRAALEKVEGANAYRVTGRVAAKEMNDPVELKFFQNNVQKDFGIGSKTNKQSSFTYTVQDYMEFVKEHADDEAYSDKFTPALKALCSAMSDYGSYAQTFFGHDAGNAADIQNAAAIAAISIADDAYTYTYTADTANIAYYGESVVTESETAIRFYFMLSGSVDGYTVTVNGEEGTLVKAGKYYYVAVNNIAAKDLGKANTVTVTYGEEALTISGYSVYTYIRKQLNLSSDENLINLVKAMKYYGDCAAEYFKEDD